MSREQKKKWLFDKPQGPSEKPWHTSGGGTINSVICEGCGTVHPEQSISDDSYSLSYVFGRQIIDECCGAFFDRLYTELGRAFFQARASDFEKDPLSSEFGFDRITIEFMVNTWAKAAAKAKEESAKVASKFPH